MCESFTQLDHQFDQSVEFWSLPPSALRIFLLLKNRCGHSNRPAYISADDAAILGTKPNQNRAALRHLCLIGFITPAKKAVIGHSCARYVINYEFKSQAPLIDLWKSSSGDSSSGDLSPLESSSGDLPCTQAVKNRVLPKNVTQEGITSPKNTSDSVESGNAREDSKSSRASDETETCKSSTNTDSKSSPASEPFFNHKTGLWENVSDTAAQAPVINISLLEEFIQTVRSTAIEEIKTTQQLIDSKAAKQIIITQLELLQAHNEDHRYQSLIKSLGQIGYQLMVAISSAPTDLTTNTQHFTDVSTRLVACGRGCGKSIRLAYDTVQGKNVTVDATELKLHRCQMTDLGAVSAGVVLVENTIPAPKRALRWIEIEKKNPSERTAEEEKLLLGLRALFEKQDANTINLDQSDADRDAAGYRSKLELTEEAA